MCTSVLRNISAVAMLLQRQTICSRQKGHDSLEELLRLLFGKPVAKQQKLLYEMYTCNVLFSFVSRMDPYET